jgi:predicted O-methyltransferase YrrM
VSVYTDYIQYLWKAANEHGVHSPFVYEWVTKVLYDKHAYQDYTPIEQLKKDARSNHTKLSFIDLGAGNQKESTISRLASRSAVPTKYGRLLFRMARWFQPTRVIELGTSLGFGTSYIAQGLGNNGHLDSIEGSPEIATIAEQHISKLGLSSLATVHKGSIDERLPELFTYNSTFDMAYIDANHRLAPTLSYFNFFANHATDSSFIIFDDIYWSEEMKEAWKQIQQDERIQVSIDLFRFGIVFFRRQQAKEHFIIRF